MAWAELAIAMALFLLSHRIPAALGIKHNLVAALGPRGYTVVFSIASLALLWWVIGAAGRAPDLPLWDQAHWHRWAVNLAMPAAIVLASFGIAAPNPFAFEGRARGFDPDCPGIAGLTRQPLLWALALWSGAHLLANGDQAHLMVFGPFVALSLAAMPMVEARRRKAMGRAQWQAMTARTSLVPAAALITGRWPPQSLPSWRRLAIAGLIWGGLWQLHLPLIGVWPAP